MMDPLLRFEILGTLGQGDFATVYHARDRELGREVAIKQIHQQYLQDPRQLERYWQEAQLLAKLEHPHIMTIYDIVRERGWLVLELMSGSLQNLLGGRPIDLNDLRMTILYSVHALHFLQQHGIFHGDVKPGNLMVDKNQRVKLGDFGIARRLVSDHGSVLKGTAKYMAPEVFSDQFGPPGPHSDLYSLGFTAFELMCGANFDSLFPGLNMYGKDQQMAWMMWHAAPDRRLPEIHRVLQGVPGDLAHVIQKMTEKDPAKRYRTAEEVVADLRGASMSLPPPSADEEAQRTAVANSQARKKKLMIYGAFATSMLLSGAMLFSDYLIPKKPPETVAKGLKKSAKPKAGVVGEFDLPNNIFFMLVPEAKDPEAITVDPEVDRVFVNEQRVALKDIQQYDKIRIEYGVREGKNFKEIFATRPQESTTDGMVVLIHSLTDHLDVSPDGGTAKQKIYVPSSAKIELNGSRTMAGGRAVKLDDLKPQDRVTVRHIPEEGGRLIARHVQALRLQNAQGSLVTRNRDERKVTIAVAGQRGSATNREFALAPKCAIIVNGQTTRNGEALSVADLLPGDQVSVAFDTLVHRIEAKRDVQTAGKIVALDGAKREMAIEISGTGESRLFAIAETCDFTLRDSGAKVETDFLRSGDMVAIEFEALDEKTFRALKVVAAPVSDPRTWIVIVAQQHFDDPKIPPLPYIGAEAARVRETLVARYRVPSNQVLFEQDASKLRMEQDFASFLPNVSADAQLICWFSGQAFDDDAGNVVLAPKEFATARPTETGVRLRWLIGQLEACPCRDKLLLLDTRHPLPAADLPRQLSAAEQAESLKESPKRPVSSSVTVIASCEKGQQGISLDNNQRSVFGSALANAFHGAADTNRDRRINTDELFLFLTTEMPKLAATSGRKQAPVRYLPDATPARLSVEAREAITRLLRHLKATRYEPAMEAESQQAQSLAPGQPDATIAYGLVLLKHNRTTQSLPVFERVASEHPRSVVTYQALAWQHMSQGRSRDSILALRQLVKNLPDPDANPARQAYFKHVFEFAATLREYALSAAEPTLTRTEVEELDQAVAQRGETAKNHYRLGVQGVRTLVAQIDAEIEKTNEAEKRTRLAIERRRLLRYGSINYEAVAEYLKSMFIE